MDAFQELSESISGLVKRSGGFTVRVEARKRFPTTGWVWDTSGLIVTVDHGIDREENIQIGVEGDGSLPASLVGRDPTTDTALLRVQSSSLPVAPQQDSEPLPGQLVIALGRPGRTMEASLGVLSGVGSAWRTAYGGTMDRYLRTGILMYPGFSGGPLLSASGNVIGMNTSALLRDEAAVVPGTTLARVIKSLVTHGKVKRGYLGVGTQPVRLPQALNDQIGQPTGLLVTSLEPGSPADTGGLLLGDILVKLSQHPIRTPDDLVAALSEEEIGKGAGIQVVRGGQPQTVNVILGERE